MPIHGDLRVEEPCDAARADDEPGDETCARVGNHICDLSQIGPGGIYDRLTQEVEFSDYNYPYYRRSMPEITGLLKKDGNVRLVMREWPILGEGSDFAARAALAAREQGMYQDMHDAHP